MTLRLPIAILALVVLTASASAQKPRAASALELGSDPRTEETAPSENGFASLRTGRALSLVGLDAVVRPAAPETMAREFLAGHESLLGVREADLEVVRVREGRAGTTVRFQQTVNGVPVWGTDTAVSLDLRHRVQAIYNGTRDVRTVETDPVVPARAARQSAHDYLGIEGTIHFDETNLVVWPGDEGARLAWQVRVHAAQPIGEWEAIVDAETGDLIRVADRSLYHDDPDPVSPVAAPAPHPMILQVDGTGFIFDPDPLTRAGVAYGQSGYTDGASSVSSNFCASSSNYNHPNCDVNSPQLEAARVQVSLRDITQNGSTYELKGPWAEMQDWESPFKGTFSQSSPDWSFTRENDAFEVATVYWHIDNYMRYINETLGVPARPQAYSSGVRFDAHGVGGGDQSYFTSGSDRLSFGEGCVDDAEDADVIIHELGHGLHDWLAAISNTADGLSEGFGDYVAVSYTRGLGLLSPSSSSYNWVFKWDGHNPCWSGRSAGITSNYPSGSGIHAKGQHWSTSLMRVWDVVGGPRTDAAVFEGIAMTNGSTRQPQAAQAVMQAAQNMGYNQDELDAFCSSFQQQGYTGLTCLTAVSEEESPQFLDDAIEISSARPNPFWGTTQVEIRVDEAQHVTVTVYDALGREVATLLDETLVAGRRYPVTLDGNGLDSGVYIVRAKGETVEATRRVILTR